nr:hypothetical protein GCM10020185_87820 [Pseudomonas brassicacearum subsp. brassicacearum]
MGRSQPLAMTMHGGVSVTVEVRQQSIVERLAAGYADVQAASLEEAIEMAESAKREGRALSIVVLGNMVDALEQALGYGWRPDIVTEMCPCHDPFALIPSGLTLEDAAALLETDRDAYMVASRQSMIRIVRAMTRFQEAGSVVFEYGTFVRKEAVDAGMSKEEAFAYPGCIAEYVRPLFFSSVEVHSAGPVSPAKSLTRGVWMIWHWRCSRMTASSLVGSRHPVIACQ